MPAGLWAAAVSLAREHGVARVARALGVDYGALKRRVSASDADGGAGFVALDPAVLMARSDPAAVVEYIAADGSKLVMRGAADDRLDIERLVAAFWRRS
jgi:hypothetical protein